MDTFKQVAKSLRKDREETALNTRRIQANLPSIERKLDEISGEQPYRLEFPLSRHKHHVSLNLKMRPDNCCDCEPGATTVKRDAIAYFTSFNPPSDGEMHPIIFSEPLQQTGTIFNYGYSSPFFHPIYQVFHTFGGYIINPAGGVQVPVDGMYSVQFRNNISLQTFPDTYMTLAILQNGESISQKTYTVAGGNLPLHELGTFGRAYFQYAFCIPLHEGDTVGPGVRTNAPFIDFEPGYWIGSPRIEDSTRITLMGLGFGTLIGLVYDQNTGLPISGATVSFTMGFGGSTTTLSNGRYEFLELTPGFYSVTASKAGYTSMTRDIEVLFDEVVSLDFNLSP
jgi:hypothetical protein